MRAPSRRRILDWPGLRNHPGSRPVSCTGKQSLRNHDDVQIGRQQPRSAVRHDHGQSAAVIQHHVQRRGHNSAITAILDHPLRTDALEPPAARDSPVVPQQPRTHHGHQRQGNDGRNHDGNAASVMANSWNNRPTTSPMNSSGISTASSDTVSDMMVKPIWPLIRLQRRRPAAPSPSSTIAREIFSIITIASSTTKPVATVSDISDKVIQAENPQPIHRRQRADQRYRHRKARE